MKCRLCGSSEFIFDEIHDELYCPNCGFVVRDVSIIEEVKYDMKGLHRRQKYLKHLERNRRYWKKKGREKMLKKFEKCAIKHGKKEAMAHFDRFISKYNQKGIPNNIISRDMEKLFLEYFKVKV